MHNKQKLRKKIEVEEQVCMKTNLIIHKGRVTMAYLLVKMIDRETGEENVSEL